MLSGKVIDRIGQYRKKLFGNDSLLKDEMRRKNIAGEDSFS